ncbi:MAG TPA: molecular chaperone HtpG [Ignavibacteriales bacterium]|nr:molecular chaperone HtpG [Ignavibacteriales bacterium]
MKDEQTMTNKYEFKAEVKKLLDILVHSLYTNKEIFLRELISNASDALDKLRFESARGTEIENPELPQEIKITADKDKNILRITDTGIGMTREEVITNIGTIAKSGSEDFIKSIQQDSKDISNIIGKFGVGFYSVFMVASKVKIRTKSYKKGGKPVEWISDGLGSYELNEIDGEIKRGTEIEIYLKDDAKDYAEKYRLEDIIKKHSNFVTFPIYLESEKINTIQALWREPKFNIKKEQYAEFYKFLTYDSEEPWDTLHISVDAPVQYNALLFIPKKNIDIFGVNRNEYGLDLYVKRVLIQKQNKDILPEYLSFIKGVVDSEDIPLNISRETLQENAVISKIAGNLTAQVLNFLKKKAADEPDKYNEFWKEHGKIFKLGYADFANRDKYGELLRFNSSHLIADSELTSFENYIARKKTDQKEIYYISGPGREAIEHDPHIEIFKRKSIEVLYMFDPLDEFALDSLRVYKEFALKSVEQADLSQLEKYEDVNVKENKFEKLTEDEESIFSKLLERIKDVLGDRIIDVKISQRLSDSPSCLINPDGGITSQMQKILHIVNKDTSIPKKIFEVNKEHPIFRNLIKIYNRDNKDPYINLVIEHLYESSLLAEGYLTDPHKMIDRTKTLLEKSSEWYAKIQ